MTFLKKHWQIAAALALIAFMFFFGWRLFGAAAKAIDLGAFVVLGVGLLLVPIAGMGDEILRKLNEQATTVTNETTKKVASVSWPSPRTHRQELELALVNRSSHCLAIVPEAGDNAKMMLDRLLARDAVNQSLDTAFQELATPSTGAVLRSAGYGNASCGGCQKADTIKLPVVDAGADAQEREIQAKGLTAPRVTKEDIEAEIVSEHYFIGSDAIQQANAVHVFGGAGWYLGATQRMTFCVLQLKNGFTVTGESACVSPENFDAQIGRDIARANAIEKMWLLLGFRLADKLAGADAQPTHQA
ncbi:Gp49 family protein [Comamonas sp. B-9]|uniref:Gp49 family protein n=1 Tax=Comamonas sp. B-9 TaxID=1055192 RepID=UPI0003957A91|nr:Gp49 family protein [Comamonas sp. B-9]